MKLSRGMFPELGDEECAIFKLKNFNSHSNLFISYMSLNIKEQQIDE